MGGGGVPHLACCPHRSIHRLAQADGQLPPYESLANPKEIIAPLIDRLLHFDEHWLDRARTCSLIYTWVKVAALPGVEVRLSARVSRRTARRLVLRRIAGCPQRR